MITLMREYRHLLSVYTLYKWKYARYQGLLSNRERLALADLRNCILQTRLRIVDAYGITELIRVDALWHRSHDGHLNRKKGRLTE